MAMQWFEENVSPLRTFLPRRASGAWLGWQRERPLAAGWSSLACTVSMPGPNPNPQPYPAFIAEPFLTGCSEDATMEACACALDWFERNVPFADFIAAFSDAVPSPAQGERWMIEASLTCAAELNVVPDR